jgi:UPF0755 protein
MNTKNTGPLKKMSASDFSVIIVIAVCSVIGSVFIAAFVPVSGAAQQAKEININYGTGLKKISSVLRSEGLIRNRFAFELYAVVTRSNKKFQAGEYEFSGSMSAAGISAKMVKGDVKKHKVVVPEGSDTADMDRIFADSGMLKAGEILAAVGDKAFMKIIGVQTPSAEGLLFPDTYYVIRGETAAKIVQTMYDRFREKSVIDINRTYNIQGYKAAGYKVLIMASIIEKESRLDAERPMVASVFYNRLKSPEAYQRRLESCATVRYALNKKRGIITYKDLKVDNPYNTYIRIGLPPGPICSPGLESMEAALKPDVTKFRYFVLYDNGEHTFSETLEEHNKAKVMNKKIRQDME